MQIKPFNIDDYQNSVADAIIKMGGVEKAADLLDTLWLEVEDWIRRGHVPTRLAQKIHGLTRVPMHELLWHPGLEKEAQHRARSLGMD